MDDKLGDWTRIITKVAVETCKRMGWHASAIDHKSNLLPIPRSEYLAIDVMAFADQNSRWSFPKAVIELENSMDNVKIAYSLWKLLCVRADLRIVICYRRESDQGPNLIKFLRDEVIKSIELETRSRLEGETIVVIGNRGEATTFPYGFFKWWYLDTNIGSFRLM